MYTFTGTNPTKLYLEALNTLIEKGDLVSPRGKQVKELRPAIFEYQNPLNRVTFLGSRRINPFFQLAESLWIISGRADVEWLTKFNANMSQFSDDGVWFNAPYGERIRTWNKNSAHNFVFNPIDQLEDAYRKLKEDKDTRQAVVVISNPLFDNSKYTIDEQGKDIACNLIFTLKIRNNKLDITVFNRSNDLHWGVMGANLCQFSTIQEVLANWLGVEVGVYNQITDSLHIYLDTYGSKCSVDAIQYYRNHSSKEVDEEFIFSSEPRMSLNKEAFDKFLEIYWGTINDFIMDDEFLSEESNITQLIALVQDFCNEKVIDEYWSFVIKSMVAYRLFKLDNLEGCLNIVKQLPNSQWKVSMMYFLKSVVRKRRENFETFKNYKVLEEKYNGILDDIYYNSGFDKRVQDHLWNYLGLDFID